MGIFKYYKFQNVETATQCFENLKTVAETEGWTIDKYISGEDGELYLHSLGNGNQSLYYSMTWFPFTNDYGDTAHALRVYGNTGFDDTLAVNNQPGNYNSENVTSTRHGNPNDAMFITFPINCQYVFVNNSQILMFIDHFFNSFHMSDTFVLDGRYIESFYIGSIDLYKSDDSYGNILVYSGFTKYSDTEYDWHLLGASTYYSNVCGAYDLYYDGVKSHKNGLLGISINICYIYCYTKSYMEGINFTRELHTVRGFNYVNSINFNDFTNKAILIKPIVYIKHSVEGYDYFFPIGELPFYASVHSPYFYVGQEVSYGTRNFVAMTYGKYNNNYGVIIEIE